MKRVPKEHDWLVVDGYNVIGAWQDMRSLAADDLADARDQLADRLLDYCGHTGQTLVLVFDAHNTTEPLRQRAMTEGGGHRIVYTKRGQTADNYIERFVRDHHDEPMTVASSDALVQVMIFVHAARISSRELENAVERQRDRHSRREREQYAQKQGLGSALGSKEFAALDALRYASNPEPPAASELPRQTPTERKPKAPDPAPVQPAYIKRPAYPAPKAKSPSKIPRNKRKR